MPKPHAFQSTPRPWLMALGLAIATTILGPTRASELRRTAIVKAVERARPSVVNIHGHKTITAPQEDFGGGEMRRVNGMGTGVVIDERGYIITNYHVVEGVRRIQVTLANRRTYTARLVARDPVTDLAIIRIPIDKKMPVIKIGTSHDLMPGEPVVAVGNAFGYQHTVTRGIISALHRDVPISDTQEYRDLIQTDASINPGNSGGPLLNVDGDLIGINVAVRVGAQGIGFAIPADKAMEVAADLLTVERIDGHWHGLTGNTTIANSAHRFVVGTVERDSPASRGGLKPGDIVTSIGTHVVSRALDVERALLGRKSGEEVKVSVERNSQPVTLSLVVAPTPRRRPTVNDRIWEVVGLRLASVPGSQVRRVSTRYRGGLNVVAVKDGTTAARQGVRPGDILVGMHIWETISLDNVAFVLNRPEFGDAQPVKCYLLRDGETLYTHLPVSLPKERGTRAEN